MKLPLGKGANVNAVSLPVTGLPTTHRSLALRELNGSNHERCVWPQGIDSGFG